VDAKRNLSTHGKPRDISKARILLYRLRGCNLDGKFRHLYLEVDNHTDGFAQAVLLDPSICSLCICFADEPRRNFAIWGPKSNPEVFDDQHPRSDIARSGSRRAIA
jgi:hypothetical protein